ncbi:MAG: sigma-54-dependent Fis family transcriptional regulator [Nitrospira sp.]|nr:sigma-54-dependent Fis family transcriptional regulator [Nitrospira sp.]MBH0180993.1 sigma-54-dependent Fis family transcriptional regulator [Nitrospira sp.]MBH0186483.1 sigma-54-dependent Fis family transcriptional regulator [Nitrospira sp.]
MSARILIVDDDPDILLGLKQRLEWMGHHTLTAADGAAALTAIQYDAPTLVILDLELPLYSGIEVLERLNGLGTAPGQHGADAAGWKMDAPFPPIIVLTAFGTIGRAVEAMKLGAVDFLTKPFDPDHLAMVIQKALERESLKREIVHLRSDLDARYSTVVAESASMKDVVIAAKRAAASSAIVLLQGETGTGKELLARSIHRWSPRKHRPFMVVNCAALPENLLENELFGHERGAYTGATHMQEGKVEAADGGTVFLDEIGDMPLLLQSRFLRLLQDKEFQRVGGTRSIRVDVRFVAATNKDLAQCVQRGTFRQDLYYRLNVLPMVLPPLRERLDDVPDLAAYILKREVLEHGAEDKRLSAEAVMTLSHYHWPGNIRELENILARAVILSDQAEIQTVHLGLPSLMSSASGKQTSEESILPYHESMESHSRWLITEALRRTGWNQTKAAAILQLQRTYFTKLLKQKNIPLKSRAE